MPEIHSQTGAENNSQMRGKVLKRESECPSHRRQWSRCYTHIIDRSAKRLCYVEFMYQTVDANILFDEGIQC